MDECNADPSYIVNITNARFPEDIGKNGNGSLDCFAALSEINYIQWIIIPKVNCYSPYEVMLTSTPTNPELLESSIPPINQTLNQTNLVVAGKNIQ